MPMNVSHKRTPTLRGRIEELERSLDEQSTNLKIYDSEINDRLKVFEPTMIEVEGVKGKSQPGEKELYDLALKEFQDPTSTLSDGLFTQFINAYPKSPSWPLAQYWLSISKYATKDYRGSILAANELIKRYPDHPRVPAALLNIATSRARIQSKTRR
jgi:TolA-binding protein